jgi:hypothetical protein
VDDTQDAVPPREVDQSILNAVAESTTRQRRSIGGRGLMPESLSAHDVQRPAPARLIEEMEDYALELLHAIRHAGMLVVVL